MNSVAYLPQSKRLLEQVSEVLRYKHYSLKTEQAYMYWVRFFVRWCGRGRLMKHPRRIGLESDPDCSPVATLGMTFSSGKAMPAALASGVFIGEHGSWNRKPRSGYKVVFVPFTGARPSGLPIDVLTGFISPNGDAYGRPVGVAMDPHGALLVADDVGNAIWRVSGPQQAASPRN